MKLSQRILLFLIKKWKSDWGHGHPNTTTEAGSENHNIEYAFGQLKFKTMHGLGINVYSKNVLEIGCGHGGICVFAAMNGAKKVTGIDLSGSALSAANKFKGIVESDTGYNLNISFQKMSAEKLKIENEDVDLIIADNVFEHVSDISIVLKECHRVLSSNGKIIVPNFPSYRSKYGPHVKYGVKIPWVHIFFKEETVVQVMHEIAEKDPLMYKYYPGLKKGAKTFREVRAYNDLNYISNRKFMDHAKQTAFSLERLYVTRPRWAWLLIKLIPLFRRTALEDILSIGTSAILVKK